MKIKLLLLTLGLTFSIARGQEADTLVKKLDSLNKKADSLGYQNNNTQPEAYNKRTQITLNSYFVLLWSNYKQQFTAPFYITGSDWKKVGTFTLLTGALAFADKPIQEGALRFKNSSPVVARTSRFITNVGGVYESITLGAIGVYGFAFNNEKMQTTTLLASQAYLTSATMSFVGKTLSGRYRPSVYSENQVTANPTFKGPFADLGRDQNGKKQNSSFPSGHTAAAFSAATVYAMEYKQWRWVPIVSYATASLISVSRLTENKHWATDILVGAALGHLSGRQVVNNYHRYAKIKTNQTQASGQADKKRRFSYGLGMIDGTFAATLRFDPN